MKKKVRCISNAHWMPLENEINEFLEEYGARWKLVTVYYKEDKHYAWLEFEG